MAAAAMGGGSKAAAALAANDAYEGALDQVLALGWAHVDRASFDAFAVELKSAPPSTAAALQVTGCLTTQHTFYLIIKDSMLLPYMVGCCTEMAVIS